MLKTDVIKFFKKEGFSETENKSHQVKALELLEKLDVKYCIETDHRNYSHSIGAAIDFDLHGKMLDAKDRKDLGSDYEIIEKHGEIITIYLTFSDIGLYLHVFANRRFIDTANEVQVEYLLESAMPALAKRHIDGIVNRLTDKLNYTHLERKLLDRKVDWLKQISDFSNNDYEPSVESLVFGDFTIYSELGI